MPVRRAKVSQHTALIGLVRIASKLTTNGSQTDQHRQLSDHLNEGRLPTHRSRSRMAAFG